MTSLAIALLNLCDAVRAVKQVGGLFGLGSVICAEGRLSEYKEEIWWVDEDTCLVFYYNSRSIGNSPIITGM